MPERRCDDAWGADPPRTEKFQQSSALFVGNPLMVTFKMIGTAPFQILENFVVETHKMVAGNHLAHPLRFRV